MQYTTAAADTDTIGLILLPTSLAGGGGLMMVDGKLELRAVRSSLKLEAVEGQTSDIVLKVCKQSPARPPRGPSPTEPTPPATAK